MDCNGIIKYLIQKIDDINRQGTTIGLIGDLGVGKTFLVKELATKLSEDFVDQVSSPTYNICNIYKSGNLEIHHYDLYRIEEEDELNEIGLMDSIENKQLLVFIEWIDLFPHLVGLCDDIISITVNSNQKRNYKPIGESSLP